MLIVDALNKYQKYSIKKAISLKINVRNDNKYKIIQTKKLPNLKNNKQRNIY